MIATAESEFASPARAPERALPSRCPFPGLRAFDIEDNEFFFGRERHLTELLERLGQHHFVAVIGPSGAGKSSLVRAGLLPELHGGNLVGASSYWRTATCLPGDAPMQSLAIAVASLKQERPLFGGGLSIPPPEADVARARMALGRSSVGLLQAVGELALPDRENILIVVDQFEELFTYRDKRRTGEAWQDDTADFVNLLLGVIRPGTGHPGAVASKVAASVYIVITMRTDFLEHCGEFPEFSDTLNRGQFLVPRLNDQQQSEAITRPLEAIGMTAENALLQRILNDVRQAKDELPVLQHALRRTWLEWKRDPKATTEMRLSHYVSAGGLEGAIDAHAEQIWKDLNERQQRLAEVLFRRITRIDSTGKRTRDPARLEEIAPGGGAEASEFYPIVEAFRDPEARFLRPAPPTKLTPETKVDVSHEAVFRTWDRAFEWMDDEQADARSLQDLHADAQTFKASGELLTGLRLDHSRDFRGKAAVNPIWACRYDVDLTQVDELLKASTEAEARAARKHRNQVLQRIGLGVLAAAVVVLAIIYGRTKHLSDRLETSLEQTKASEATALSALGTAQREKAEKEAQRKHAEEAEHLAKQNESKATAALEELKTSQGNLVIAQAAVVKAKAELEGRQTDLKKLEDRKKVLQNEVAAANQEAQAAAERARKARAEAIKAIETKLAVGESTKELTAELQSVTFERDQLRDRIKSSDAQVARTTKALQDANEENQRLRDRLKTNPP